ncbi:50S ribosomal protein L11 [candidate division Kazan bacterium]|uniref:Large ribosomal subunit protein uL11 n=1 Tax=candidate division Kazan bacterium TaxID=2202143 RepID=A0A420ZD56_UNCK3|nr:MAG: 50S ribosomal protein L11 [candidate division Kazan bacterium]
MAKKVLAVVKLQCEAGKANPAPPVGTALGPHGIQIMDFCKQFNDRTKDMMGNVVPSVITIYEDRSFDFILKQPPASALIKKMLNLEKGSAVPNKEKVAKLTRAQLKEIAEKKMPDLNANNIEAAMKIIEGTAKNMGVEVQNGPNGMKK